MFDFTNFNLNSPFPANKQHSNHNADCCWDTKDQRKWHTQHFCIWLAFLRFVNVTLIWRRPQFRSNLMHWYRGRRWRPCHICVCRFLRWCGTLYRAIRSVVCGSVNEWVVGRLCFSWEIKINKCCYPTLRWNVECSQVWEPRKLSAGSQKIWARHENRVWL